MTAAYFQLPPSFPLLGGLLPPFPFPPLFAIVDAHCYESIFDRDWEAMRADPILDPREKNLRERSYLSAKAELNEHMSSLLLTHFCLHVVCAISLLANRVFKGSLFFTGLALLYGYTAKNRMTAQQPLMQRMTILWEQCMQSRSSDESRRDLVDIANDSMKLRFHSAFTPRTLEQWQGTAPRA